MTDKALRDIVASNIRKVSTSKRVDINNRPDAATLLYMLCYCAFKEGDEFWKNITAPQIFLGEVFETRSYSLGSWYVNFTQEVAKIKCGELEISQSLKNEIKKDPAMVAEAIIEEANERFGYRTELATISPELAKLCAYLLKEIDACNILNPFAGMMSVAVSDDMRNIGFNGYELSPATSTMAKMRLEMNGCTESNINNLNVVLEWENLLLNDVLFSIPPLNMPVDFRVSKKSDRKHFQVEEFLIEELCQNDSIKKAVILVSGRALFSTPLSHIPQILLKRGLKSVIALPSGALRGTGVKTYLLTIDKTTDHKSVRFASMLGCVKKNGRKKVFDVDEAISILETFNHDECEADIEEIVSKSYDLNPGSYLYLNCVPTRPGYKKVRLCELLKPIDTTSVRSSDSKNPLVVGSKDLFEVYNYDHTGNQPTSTPQSVWKELNENAILLSFWQDRIRVGIANVYQDKKPVLIGKDVYAYKTDIWKVDADYLLAEFSQPYVLKQYRMLSHGLIGNECILDRLVILLPSMHEQEKRSKAGGRARMEKLHDALQLTEQTYRKDVHMKRHALGQTMATIGSCWRMVSLLRDQNKSPFNEDALVPNTDVTLRKVLDDLKKSIARLDSQIKRFDRGYNFSPEQIDTWSFIEDYIENHSNPTFKFDFSTEVFISFTGEESLGDFLKFDEGDNLFPCIISFPREVLKMAFNNIMNNAYAHGFHGISKPDNFVKIAIELIGGDVVISISNNGEAAPEDMSPDKIIAYGESSSKESHCGIGGYEIKHLLNEYGGELEIKLDSSNEFPVEYRLSFPNVSPIIF